MSLETVLKKDGQGFTRPFGDPKITNKATTRAVIEATSLRDVLLNSKRQLEELSQVPGSDNAQISLTLNDVDQTIRSVSQEIGLLKRNAAAESIKEVRQLLASVKLAHSGWRAQYPDVSPIKIDNSSYQNLCALQILLIVQHTST